MYVFSKPNGIPFNKPRRKQTSYVRGGIEVKPDILGF
jgi:hypothetical protein